MQGNGWKTKKEASWPQGIEACFPQWSDAAWASGYALQYPGTCGCVLQQAFSVRAMFLRTGERSSSVASKHCFKCNLAAGRLGSKHNAACFAQCVQSAQVGATEAGKVAWSRWLNVSHLSLGHGHLPWDVRFHLRMVSVTGG